jgi:hypothetical protein
MKINFKMMAAVMAVLGAVSCSKSDVFDPGQAEEIKKAQEEAKIEQAKTDYEANFVEKYGEVDPNQSWDFSTNQQRLGTRGEGDQIVTKIVDGLDFGKITYTNLGNNKMGIKGTRNNALLSAITKVLPEGTKHQGETVTLVAPSNSFTIYPLTCQGAWTHDLMVKVGDNAPVTVYQKDWIDYSVPYANGTTFSDGSKARMRGLYVEAPIGTPIEIYLDNICEWSQTWGQWQYSRKKAAGTSNGQAIYVEVGNDVKPEGVTLVEGAIVKYIGIEDNPKGDLDYNDVVLAVVGNPDVPEEIKIENNEYQVPVSVTKRYMMEDLGSTDDFDFNDVVVDVTETTVYTHKVTIVNGVKESDVVIDTKKTQKAVVRHLGGILPFQLTIGETTLPEMGSEATWKTNPDTEYEVKGWNPAQNNVSVTVKSTESQMYNVTNKFPKEGEFPMMFACDPEIEWAAERQGFDFSQFPGYKGE